MARREDRTRSTIESRDLLGERVRVGAEGVKPRRGYRMYERLWGCLNRSGLKKLSSLRCSSLKTQILPRKASDKGGQYKTERGMRNLRLLIRKKIEKRAGKKVLKRNRIAIK